MFLQLLVVFIASVVLTGLFRQYALWRNVMDIPNERSSHSVPTPRGGGAAIVIVYLVGFIYQQSLYGFSSEQLALFAGGMIMAWIGFMDDHHSLSARWRLIVQFLVAVMIVLSAGDLPNVHIGEYVLRPDIIGYPLLIVGLVWMMNLYNFMDGIDGLAGIEVVSVCFLVSVIYWLCDFNSTNGYAVLLLGSSSLGFLIWNYPPAKIFMGDVGSGFIGLLLGGFMLGDADIEPKYLFVWLILLAVFIIDATMTLICRCLKRENFLEAHKIHAFQYASRFFKSHKIVTHVVLCINVLWLAPIATFVAKGWIAEIPGFILAYVPLLILWGKVCKYGKTWDLQNSIA